MRRLASAVAGLTGWRRDAAAAAAGAISVLALAPLHLWFVPFATLSLLVWLTDGNCARAATWRRRLTASARTGWFFGCGFFFAGLSWVGNSFLVEAEVFAWAMPVAVLAMAAGMALFHAAGVALAAVLWRPGIARLVALTLGLTAAEMARGTLFTGLPWNTLGYALAPNVTMMQWASLVGVYGLTFLAVAVFTAPAAICVPAGVAAPNRKAALLYTAAALAVLAAGWGWGKARLAAAPSRAVAGVRLRIVQPNIPQIEKWKPDNRAPIFRKYLELSQRGPATAPAGLEGVTHLVWPESALPFLLADTVEALAAIAELLPGDTALLTGQARAEDELRPDGSLKRRHVYNSLFVMNTRAQIEAIYDKLHLVPFGEYLPFQGLLESVGLEQLTRVRGGFTPGTRRRFLTPPGAPAFVPLICYEIIFPHAIRAPGTDPKWMLNVTNDAWFGRSLGPYQHFHQARVRAVEQGLGLVRAANTGISAIVDPYGRIVASLPLGQEGVIDGLLPAAAPRTPFSRYGRITEAAFLVAFAIGWAALARGRSGPRTG